MREPFPPGCAARYQHIKLLAQGGFGSVHLARQVKLNREVAIKLLHNDELADPDIVTRFLAEAKVTASLSHPAIVQVIDHDVEDGTPWIAYEYLPGRSLDAAVRAGALPWRTVAEAGAQVAEALQEAHAHGVLHRDVKPANVMEAGPGQWKLTDFGIARWTAATRMLTKTGEAVGTMGYIAPEVVSGEEPSPAADIYALGVTLQELLLGHHPYEGSIVKLLQMQARGEGWIAAPASRVRSLPAAIDAALVKAVQRKPEERFESAGAFATALRGTLAARASRPVQVPRASLPSTDRPSAPPEVKPWMVAVAFTLIGVGIGGAVMWAMRPAPAASPSPVSAPSVRPRIALAPADQAAIRAALAADENYFNSIRSPLDKLHAMMIGTLHERMPEIRDAATAIEASDTRANLPLLELEPRLPPSLNGAELDPVTAMLAARLAKAIFWHHTRISRHRQIRTWTGRFIREGKDNLFASAEIGHEIGRMGNERTCLEPARRWVQRLTALLEQLDERTDDETAWTLVENFDHFARYLSAKHWHGEAQAEWGRLAASLSAALARPGNPMRTAFGALFTDRVAASWTNQKPTPEVRARMDARLAEIESMGPPWPRTLPHLKKVVAR